MLENMLWPEKKEKIQMKMLPLVSAAQVSLNLKFWRFYRENIKQLNWIRGIMFMSNHEKLTQVIPAEVELTSCSRNNFLS